MIKFNKEPKLDSTVYIPDNVEWIDSGAFEDCINLKRVSIPGSCDFDKDTFYKGVEIIRR